MKNKDARQIALGVMMLFSFLGFTRDRYATLNSTTPDQLIKNLISAAQKPDIEDFLSGLTDDSRKAVEESYRRQASLNQKQDEFRNALDKRFGGGTEFFPDLPDSLDASIKRFVSAEVLSQNQKPDGSVEMRVKTTLKNENKETVISDDNIIVSKTNGGWKLSLGFPTAKLDLNNTVAVIERVTREVNEGKYSDRVSAMLELDKALRTQEVTGK